MKQTKNARQVALAALVRCEKNGYSNLVLDKELKSSTLTGRDRAFAARLVYGTVERKLTLEARLAPFLQRPLEQMPPELRCILRSGLYQILYMNSVPASAAVNESVILAKKSGQGKAAGFVNAVLRRAGSAEFAPSFESDAHRLSVTWSIGMPIASLLLKSYPEKAEAICEASFTEPLLTVRTNITKTTNKQLIERLAQDGVSARETLLPDALVLESAKEIAALPAFLEGLFHVQGLASQLTVAALGVKPEDAVLDLCAAPGGKTATLAQSLGETGRLTACELHENRLSLIKSLVQRLGLKNVTVMQNDGSVYNESLGLYDKILCDVPCSGLGTLAKKPDIRYKDLDGLPTLIKTQKNILQTASRYLKPGGVLVYSTCTINPKENQAVVEDFLASNTDFCADTPLFAEFGGEKVGLSTLFLPNSEIDGFFIARLCKK